MAEVIKIKIFDTDGAKVQKEFKRDRKNASLNRWKEKMYGQFQRQLIKISPGSGIGKVT